MRSPYIETFGITEREYNNIQTTMRKMKMHPELQLAIDTRTNATVDGDHYNEALEALAFLGFTKGERLSFKDPSIKGVFYHDKTHTAKVSKANFIGVFTDIEFIKK